MAQNLFQGLYFRPLYSCVGAKHLCRMKILLCVGLFSQVPLKVIAESQVKLWSQIHFLFMAFGVSLNIFLVFFYPSLVLWVISFSLFIYPRPKSKWIWAIICIAQVSVVLFFNQNIDHWDLTKKLIPVFLLNNWPVYQLLIDISLLFLDTLNPIWANFFLS